MTLKTPSFWYRNADSEAPIRERMLAPFSKIYQMLYALDHCVHKAYKADIPVVCIGNIVAGGHGEDTDGDCDAQAG